jgi:hypothetical protein
MLPWEHHSAFTRERLITIAELIAAGRNAALDRRDPTVGSDAWTVGCEAFAFQRFRIKDASEHIEWLEIIDPTMQFVFAIEGLPCRFYRGEPNEPTERTLEQSFPELNQFSLFGDDELKRLGQRPGYRFAVETDIDGSVIQISFVALSGAVPVLIWAIPLDFTGPKIAPLWSQDDQGIELPPPAVGLPKSDAKRRGANDD